MSEYGSISTENNQNKAVRYIFFIIVIALVALAISLLINFKNNITKPVPDGYKFSVVDHTTKDTEKWATYYVYDTYIIVYKDQKNEKSKASPSLIYEGLDTSGLVLDEKSTAKTCDSDACYTYPKVLNAIKKLLVGRPSREYLRP